MYTMIIHRGCHDHCPAPFSYSVRQKGYFHLFPFTVGILSPLISFHVYVSSCVSKQSAGVIILFGNSFECHETYKDTDGRLVIAVIENDLESGPRPVVI